MTKGKYLAMTCMVSLVLILAMQTRTQAADHKKWNEGKNVDWTYSKGTLTVSPKKKSSSTSGKSWKSKGKKVKNLVIKKGITRIPEDATECIRSVRKVTIPKTVSTIDSYAFKSCTKLVKITLPAQLKILGESAFEECWGLKKVVIPSKVVRIEAHAFDSCMSLEKVTVQSGVLVIGHDAFYNCSKLSKVSLPKSIKCIDSYAFSNTKVKKKEIKASVNSKVIWGKNVFSYKSVEIPVVTIQY